MPCRSALGGILMRESNDVIGKNGITAVLLDPLPPRPGRDERVRIRLSDGRIESVPADSLVAASGGTYLMPFGSDDFGPQHRTTRSAESEEIVPVLSEELAVGKKPVPTGGVRVTRKVLEHEETVELPVLKERVDVRRVVVDREVDGPLPVRREGDTMIIPIVEEEIAVMKRYRLREEVHVTRLVREELHRERVTVKRQEPVIEHLDANGRAYPMRSEEREPAVKAGRRPRKSILGKD